ncbi:MAG: saccharopine dehydrogenase C-terminal domain-containing protein [Thermoanaerobaculia bacterium]
MTTKIAVLGCGLVGGLIAHDLASDPGIEVHAFDASERALAALEDLPRIRTARADLSDPKQIANAVRAADAVVGAVPGRYGTQMLRTVIEAGKPIADISFSPENPLALHDLAVEKGVTAVVDCGVSPGLSNLAVGRAAYHLDDVRHAVIYVGGLPVERHWPYEYRIVFSATDVIEEYTRPARLVENGRTVVKPALSEVELLDFPGIGTLEAFNTDGLRTLLATIEADNMKEKTLRYPGHADRMRMLRESGFFSDEPLETSAGKVRPRELTEALLFRNWKRPAAEEELTVLRVAVDGSKNGSRIEYTFDLLDRTDRSSGATSMARTTGFPCAIMARLLARGEYRDPGVRPPESFASNDSVYNTMVDELRRRGVRFEERSRTL